MLLLKEKAGGIGMKSNKKQMFREILFWIIRTIALGTIIYSIIALAIDKGKGNVPSSQYVTFILQSVVLFACTFVPIILDKLFKINIPIYIELVYLVFVTMCILFGEMFNFYVKYSWWDDVLHTFSGSFIASLALMDVYFLNEKKKNQIKLSPGFIIIFCFCFAMTGCLIWEIFEYSIDSIFGSNMQRFRDSYNNVDFIGRKALKDTMSDIIEGLIGALLFCFIAYFDVRKANNSKIKQMFNIDEEKKED